MKSSIKFSIIITNILIILITYLLIFYLASINVINLTNIFNLVNLSIISMIVIVSALLSNIISKTITFPIKKIEKNMKSMLEGKVADTKHLKGYNKVKEIDEFITTYSSMMEVIKKNNFDLNDNKSKTEIILEHMADGLIAFSTNKDVVHMNKAAMNLLEIDNRMDRFDSIFKKLNLDVDFEKIMYLPNYKSYEIKISVGDNVLNLVFVPFFNDRLTPSRNNTCNKKYNREC